MPLVVSSCHKQFWDLNQTDVNLVESNTYKYPKLRTKPGKIQVSGR